MSHVIFNIVMPVLYLTFGVLLLFLGIIILKERPRDRQNRSYSGILIVATLGALLNGFSFLLPDISANPAIFRLLAVMVQFIYPQLLLFSFYFPRSILRSTHQRLFLLIFLPYLSRLLFLSIWTSADQILALGNIFDAPLFANALQPIAILGRLMLMILAEFYVNQQQIFALINLIYIVLALVFLVQNFRQLYSQNAHQQMTIVMIGILASSVLVLCAKVFPVLFDYSVNELLVHMALLLALAFLAATTAWAIIKYHFLEIHFFIRRSLVFSMASAILVGCYLVIYSQAKRFFFRPFGYELPIVEILFLIFAAVFFQPVISWLERQLERLFSKDTPNYHQVIQELSHEILSILNIDNLHQKLIPKLQLALDLEAACLVLQQDAHVYSAVMPSDDAAPVSFLKTGEFISLVQNARKPLDIRELYLSLKTSAEIRRIRNLNMKLFIPLNHRGKLQGVFCLGARQDHQAFSEQELALLNLLSVQISIALENTQLYQERLEKQRMDEELTVAGEIQRMLLPQNFPTGKRFDISAINIPSKEVGGDYFDFIELTDDKIGIAIGDIAGKGIPGSLLMSNLQASFRAAAQLTPQPAKVMKMVNAQITRSTSPEKYATFFYGIYDAHTETFTFSNAGHNFPVLVRRGEAARMLKQSDLIIGIDATVSYQNHHTNIRAGDFLVIYTDGITEALDTQNEEFGEERFLNMMGEKDWDNPRQLRDFVYERVHAYTSGASQYDDITLVVFQAK